MHYIYFRIELLNFKAPQLVYLKDNTLLTWLQAECRFKYLLRFARFAIQCGHLNILVASHLDHGNSASLVIEFARDRDLA